MMKLTLNVVTLLLVCHPLVAAQQPATQQPSQKGAQAKTPTEAEKEKDFSRRPPAQPITALWTRPQLQLTEEIDLAAPQPGQHEAQRVVRGGQAVPGGWQATGKLDSVKIELKRGFTSEEAGALELEMTNLDFVAQVTGRKHHFFNFYADPSGDSFAPARNAFFTLRGGGYKDKAGNRGIKVLWRGGGERGELAPFATRKVWDPKAVYTWRAEWTKNELVVLLNGERIFGPAEFKERDRQMPLKYIFLSMDGIMKPVWFGFAGPIYQKVRVYREGAPLLRAGVLADDFDQEPLATFWTPELHFPYAGKFISAPVRSGVGAMKFEWHQADYDGTNRTKHAELRTKPLPAGEDERWYGFSIYLPEEGMKTDAQPEIICQWHSYPDRHLNEEHSFPPMAVSHVGDKLRIKWLSDTRPVTPKRDLTLPGGSAELGQAPLNRWIDFVVHVKWEPMGKGLLQVWQDGRQVLDKTNIAIGYNDQQNPYWKIGLYKHTGKSDFPTRFLYYDRVRIGDRNARYDDVAPRK